MIFSSYLPLSNCLVCSEVRQRKRNVICCPLSRLLVLVVVQILALALYPKEFTSSVYGSIGAKLGNGIE